jgi:hypothetical protein
MGRLRVDEAGLAGSRLVRIEALVSLLGGIALSRSLGDDPAPGRSIHREHRPALTVLVAEMNEEGVAIVLDTQPVGRVASLVEDPRRFLARICME